MKLLERMQIDLPFSNEELNLLIATASYRYKVYKIPKRQQGQFRIIAQPSAELKILQRWLVNSVLSKLPVHKAATAYIENKSIADHAAIHVKSRFLLKMDFKDFFPSISAKDVFEHLVKKGKFSEENARLICHLVCWRDRTNNKLCLSIGAPSSPFLSNAILYDFDKAIAQLCKDKKVNYSRYADDLAFSTNKEEILKHFPAEVKKICDALSYPRLIINNKKTVSCSKAFRRSLVGLILTPNGEVSLGREKKRHLRSELYRFSKSMLPSTEVSSLRGDLAFAWSVEKKFIFSLLRQFGDDVFRDLDLPFRAPTDNF